MRRLALLILLLALGCARAPERVVRGETDHAQWTAYFAGDSLRKIDERSTQAKNAYWYEAGTLRLYDSREGGNSLHVLFDPAGKVTKFAKSENGRAVAVEPDEVKKVLARADSLAAEARAAARVLPAP